MPRTQNQILADRIVALEEQVKALSSGNRLRFTSIDDFGIPVNVDGENRAIIGRQPDGSAGTSVRKVPPPPQLTAPILTAGDTPGVIETEWDGRTFDGYPMPEIHGHTEIWAQLMEEGEEPTVAPGPNAVRKGTIRDRAGGEQTIVLPYPGIWAVWLLSMGADRKTAGPWSPYSTIEVVPLVDTSEWQEQLDQARQEIADADERLTGGQEELTGKLGELEGRQESLREDLGKDIQDVYEEADRLANAARDNAVAQAATDAQAEYDRLESAAADAQAAADAVAGDVGEATQAAADAQAKADAAQAAADQVASELGDTSAAAQAAQAKADAAQAAADQVAIEAGEASQAAAEAQAKADAAQRAADDAAQAASDAHTAAGNAETLAASAYDRAGSQGSILGGLSGPSGTAPEDSYWIQWDTYGAGRSVQAVWKMEGGSWTSQSTDPRFFPNVDIAAGTVGDLEVERIRGLTAEFNRAFVSSRNLIPDPEFRDFDWWRGLREDIIGNSQNYGRCLRIEQSDIDNAGGQISVFTQRFEAIPGASYKVRFPFNRQYADDAGNDVYRVWIRRMTPTGGWHSSAFSESNFGPGGWYEVDRNFTIPDDPDIGLWELEFRIQNLDGGILWIAKPEIQNMQDGRLVVENSIKSHSVDTEEFFSAVAVIEKVWSDIVRSRLVESQGIITEDMIATGAITTPKITVTEEMVVEMAKFLRLEADSLASNEIVGMLIKGSRVEGVEIYGGDIESGRFSTSTSSGHTITIDQGTIRYQDTILSTRVTLNNAPHISIRTDGSSANDAAFITVDENRGLVLAPGRRSDGINRDVYVPSHLFAGAGTFEHRVTAGSLDGGGQSSLTPSNGLFLATSSNNQPAGIHVDGPRAYLRGRTPNNHYSTQSYLNGSVGSYSMSGTAHRYRGTITYGAPPPSGTRRPQVTARSNKAAYDAYRALGAAAYDSNSSSFRWMIHRGGDVPNTITTTFYIYYLAVWN